MTTNRPEHNSQSEALENLVIDNPELERLEELLDQFNIFEAIGVVRQELRHSDFLAFLLNPQQPHGLGDTFVKNLLQSVLLEARGSDLPINLIDLDVWSLEETTVLREWRNIDILLLDEEKRLAVIIENKIGSMEHSEQLKRYHESVEQSHPDSSIIPLYLTPEADIASDERYFPVSYRTIAELIESLVTRRESTLGSEILTLMTHYAQMLRRHIVSESEIADLCVKIYQKHKRAIDLIIEHVPAVHAPIPSLVAELVGETEGLAKDRWTSTFQCFAPKEWDELLPKAEDKWSPEGRIVLFWFQNQPGSLRIALEIGPGPEAARRAIFDIAHANTPPCKPGSAELPKTYSRIWSKTVVKYSSDADFSDLEPKIRKFWESFKANELPELTRIVTEGLTRIDRSG